MADQTDANTAEDAAAAEPASPSKKLRKKISVKRLLWMVVRIWVMLAVALYFLQGWLVFHPRTDMIGTPEDLLLDYEDIWIHSDPQNPEHKINCWYVPAKGSKGVVMFCHGNASNLSYRMDILQIIHATGYDCFMPDYSGYGRSSGSASEENMYRDSLAAWTYLTKNRGISPQKIVVHGRSLGGGAVSWLAGQITPAGLVLDSTFTSGIKLAQEKIPILPVRLFAKFEFDTIGRLDKIRCPVLFIHSKDDGLIPVHHRDRLYDSFAGEKYKSTFNGSHRDGFMVYRDIYQNQLQEFYDRVFGQGDKQAGAVAGKDVNE